MNYTELRKVSEGEWSSKFGLESRNQSHTLPKLIGKPVINYDNLKWLGDVKDLGIRDHPSSQEAHRVFMENYHRIFKLPVSLSLNPLPSDKRKLEYIKQVIGSKDIKIPHDKGLYPHQCNGFSSHMCSHNISDHLTKLHKHTVTTSQSELHNARIKVLRRLLRKLPFERKSKENTALYKHLQHFPQLANQVPLQVLKELCSVAQLDKWNDDGFTVFGNSGLHMILRGSVSPLTEPVVSRLEHVLSREFPSPTPVLCNEQRHSKTTLSIGDCFGTLAKVEGREPNSRVLSVITLEPCEFLKISTNDYERVIQMMSSREEEQKLCLVQSCKLFHNWPRLSLKKIAELVKWRVFLPGKVLVNENERCEVIGFIKKGQCLLRRLITIAHTHPDGKKEKRTKAVVIGRLGPGDSFGETTVLKHFPMPCSVTTDTQVELGTISTLDVFDLDDVTKSLLEQSYSAMDSNLTEEEIQQEHIEQEKAQQWNRFKRKMVNQVLHYRGIQPGYSKWGRNPSPQQVEKEL